MNRVFLTSRHCSLAGGDRPDNGSTVTALSPVNSALKSVITSLAGFTGVRNLS